MNNHVISQEQFDQALRDGFFYDLIEPQPPNGYEYSFTVDGSHIWARAKDMAFATPAKFQPQDNLYAVEDPDKILVVNRVEVEFVRNHKRSFDESRMVEEWNDKIFVEV